MKIPTLLCLLHLSTSFVSCACGVECTAEYYSEYFSPFFGIASGNVETSLTSQCTAKTISISVWNFKDIKEQQRVNYTKNYLIELRELIEDTYCKNILEFKENFNKPLSSVSSYIKSLWLQRAWFKNMKTEVQVIPLDSRLVSEFVKNKDIIYKLHFVDPMYTLILYNSIGKCGTSVSTFELWDLIS